MPDNTTLLTRSGLDLDVAVFLAEAAAITYSGSISIKAWALANGFGVQCTTFDHDNIQGFWCVAGEVALIAFRGTSNPGQWLRDVRFIPIESEWGRVHAGFKGGIEIAEPDLVAFEKAAVDAKHVWVTGHSLGGALAVMAAAHLKRRGISAALYTYGQPRVGLSGFADRFEQELSDKLIRFVNQSDIVPRVPPGIFYRHMGMVKHIVSNGEGGSFGLEAIAETTLDETEKEPLSEEEFAVLQESLKQPGTEAFEGALPWISDHSMTEYVRLLTEIRG